MRTAIAAGLLVVGLLATTANADHSPRVRIPHCAEDETYLKGTGDFESGSWSRYVCVHPDSLGARAIRNENAHDGIVRGICARPRHWERGHGVTVISEGCESAR